MKTSLPSAITLFLALAATAAAAVPDAGGDDVVIASYSGNTSYAHVAMASNGDLYAAAGVQDTGGGLPGIVVHRSVDGGTTWTVWGQIAGAAGAVLSPDKLMIAEGGTSRIFLGYSHQASGGSASMAVAWSALGGAAAVWNVRTVFSLPGMDLISYGDLATDAGAFSAYYLYAVTSADDGDGNDIWFSRSTDQGNTWSAPTRIASVGSGPGGYGYIYPKIAYGAPDRVHVAFAYGDYCDGGGCFDNGLRAMYAGNFASTAGDWSAVQTLTTTADGLDSGPQALLASAATSDVYLVYNTRGFALDCNLWYSSDGGTTWPAAQTGPIDVGGGHDMRFQQMTLSRDGDKLWIAGREDAGPGFCDTDVFVLESPAATPLSFGAARIFTQPDGARQYLAPAICADPAGNDDYALAWTNSNYVCDTSAPSRLRFDATWRDAPGYPVTEPGFPVALPGTPVSPPAVAQVGGGPELEIVFADGDNRVMAVQADGTSLPGWPVTLPGPAHAAPVCVGSLELGGEPTVVAGTADGRVCAYAPDGTPRPGFPVDLGTGAPAFVTVAPVLPPYPRDIVACSGSQVFVLDLHGQIVGNVWTLSQPIDYQAAVGDLDGDGTPEIVVADGNRLVVIKTASQSPEVDTEVTIYAFSDAPAIADLDRDGEREILLSTVNGWLHVRDISGGPVWSFDAGTGNPVSGAAPSHVLGTSEIEVAFTAANQMHLLLYDGTEHSSYPQAATTVFTGTPIDVGVHWSSPDMVSATWDGNVWAFVNIGGRVDGWPQALGDPVQLTPAAGDLDLDGRDELVFLTDTQLRVVDVTTPPVTGITRSWPMDAHDPGRTGCLDCAGEELVSGVGDGPRATMASFAAPQPNPANGPMTFRFALPRPSGAQLEVYDVRGRRVRLVERQFLEAGPHLVSWDGRDDHARPLASGIYYARLSLRGEGIDEVLSRKFTVLH